MWKMAGLAVLGVAAAVGGGSSSAAPPRWGELNASNESFLWVGTATGAWVQREDGSIDVHLAKLSVTHTDGDSARPAVIARISVSLGVHLADGAWKTEVDSAAVDVKAETVPGSVVTVEGATFHVPAPKGPLADRWFVVTLEAGSGGTVYLWDDDAFAPVPPPLPGKKAPALPKKAAPTVKVAKPPAGRAVAEAGDDWDDDEGEESPSPSRGTTGTVFWLDHYSLKPSSDSVWVSPVTEVPGSLDGLTVRSARGAVGSAPPWQGVEIAAGVPPGWRAVGVRVCWRLDDPRSHIRQVRIAQVQDPPESAVVQLDADGWTERGPVCATTKRAFSPIDGSKGALLVSLYLDLKDPKDRIVIRGLGLVLEPASKP